VTLPTAVFGYGSLVSAASAAVTLGRPPQERWEEDAAVPASLRGWRRRFSQARDNRNCEKTFARDADDSVPSHVLGLNVEETGDPADMVNGLLIAVDDAELDRLDVRELRYDRREVGGAVEPAAARDSFAGVITYVAKPKHHALEPPPDAVILRSYAEAVEAAFRELGPAQLDEYRRSTGKLPVEPIAAHLVADRIPEGNPRTW
jgi:cation transport regulator ChaC